jgi:hypothetical protein
MALLVLYWAQFWERSPLGLRGIGHGYDAQATTGLSIIPLMATIINSVVAGIIGTIEFLVRRNRKVKYPP